LLAVVHTLYSMLSGTMAEWMSVKHHDGESAHHCMKRQFDSRVASAPDSLSARDPLSALLFLD
jgi:hypothetical protein